MDKVFENKRVSPIHSASRIKSCKVKFESFETSKKSPSSTYRSFKTAINNNTQTPKSGFDLKPIAEFDANFSKVKVELLSSREFLSDKDKKYEELL